MASLNLLFLCGNPRNNTSLGLEGTFCYNTMNMMTFLRENRRCIIIVFLLVSWVGLHLPAVFYGTKDLPLHMSYISADEQSPVNGALHILQDKSLLSLRNLNTVYYGPVFSMIALPAVATDYALKYATGVIEGADDYKTFIIWSWGGIAVNTRLTAVLVGFLGLIALFQLLTTKSLNPSGSRLLPYFGAFLLASNFYYFEYASFFRHWVFILVILLWQLYFAIRIYEGGGKNTRYWVYQTVLAVLGFGISYLSVLFQALWLPVLVAWWRQNNRIEIKQFFLFVTSFLVLAALIVWWHPHAFFRVFGLQVEDITNTGISVLTTEVQSSGYSFYYYASIIFNNNLALVIAWLTLLIVGLRKRVFQHVWFWLPVVPLVAYFIIFGIISHHESRYILPVIVLLHVSALSLLGFCWERLKEMSIMRSVLISLFLFTLIFNITHLIQWGRIISEGPPEREVIARIIKLQENNPNEKTLFIQWYILGYVHTKEAYRDFIERTNRARYNLFQAILVTPLPTSVVPVNVYYLRPDQQFAYDKWREYTHIVYRSEPVSQGKLGPDFLEADLTRLWFYKDFSDSFIFLK